MNTKKQFVVLTGTTIDRANVFGPFDKKTAEKFKKDHDDNNDRLWDDVKSPIIPKSQPAVIVKMNGLYSWAAKVVTGK